MKSLHNWLMCAALTSVFTGCATIPLDPIIQREEERIPRPSQISTNAAVERLYSDAARFARTGEYDQAEAMLERGLRLEPKNAYLWFELARLSANSGNLQKAQSLASRAKSFAGSDRYLQVELQNFLETLMP